MLRRVKKNKKEKKKIDECKSFFNESCSICKKEIDIYKNMENELEWYDINEKESQITNLSTDQLSRRLHVMDQGKLIKEPRLFLLFG